MKRTRIEFTPFLGIGIGVSSNFIGSKILVILIPFISIEITIK